MIRNTRDLERERRKLTRRQFGCTIIRAAGASLAAGSVAYAADPDFTLAVIPDTQYLAYQCPTAFTNMMTWVVNNRAADQGGVFTTDVKAVIGVGDCSHNNSAGEFTNGQTAYSRLDRAGIPWVNPPGNHDYGNGADRAQIGSGYRDPSGYFGSARRQALGAYGILPGGGGASEWGDAYDNANYYIRLNVGSRSLLIFSIEHIPRQVVLEWAKGVADAHPDHEAIVTTHSFLTDTNEFGTFSEEPGNHVYTNDNRGQGLVTNQGASDARFNSGYAVWNSYLKYWSNLSLVVCGHWIYQAWHTSKEGASNSWFLQQRAIRSSGPRGHAVQAIFANWQEVDAGTYSALPGGGGNRGPGVYCSAFPANAAGARIAHVMLLHFRPSSGKLDGYALSTNTGLWEPTQANRAMAPTSSPQLLFSLDHTGAPPKLMRQFPIERRKK